MSKRWCTSCGGEIPEGRLKVVPDATHCVPCLSRAGDVPTPVGYMHFGHKTAPSLVVVDRKTLDTLNRLDRRGYKSSDRD